jgi:hypothetical protein
MRVAAAYVYSAELYHMDFSLMRVKLVQRKNVWPNGIEPSASALVTSWKVSLSLVRVKLAQQKNVWLSEIELSNSALITS